MKEKMSVCKRKSCMGPRERERHVCEIGGDW